MENLRNCLGKHGSKKLHKNLLIRIKHKYDIIVWRILIYGTNNSSGNKSCLIVNRIKVLLGNSCDKI